MIKKSTAATISRGLVGIVCAAALGACASHNAAPPSTAMLTEIRAGDTCPTCPPAPAGAVEFVWEEPMVDVVDVPPGLDPEGAYYRPAHQSIVEIRQGRWKYHRPR